MSRKPSSPPLSTFGLNRRERLALEQLARRVGATPFAVLGAMARITLGSPFKAGSMPFRLMDACNEVGAPRP